MNKFRTLPATGTNYLFNRPHQVTTHPTFRCNLACRQCILPMNRTAINEEIPTDEWKGIIHNLRRWLGSYYLVISGGEPLIRKDTKDIIKFASDSGIFTSMFTNGWLLRRKTINNLEDSGLDNLFISLDGFRAETHDFLRRKKSLHKRIFSAIEYIRANEIRTRVSISTTIMQPNLEEIVDMIKWVKQSGLSRIAFNAFLMKNYKAPEKQNTLWPKKGTAESVINQIMLMKKTGYPIGNPTKQLMFFKKYYRDPWAACLAMGCSAEKNINIMPDGRTKICFKMETIGNARTEPAKTFWNSEKSRAVRENIKRCENYCKILNCNFDYGLKGSIKKFLNL
jgi:MoaA/NifB/PqqE/SkfB family radical SAM enzyme